MYTNIVLKEAPKMLKTLFSKKWTWIVGGVTLVLLAGAAFGVLALLGFLPWQTGTVYEDPQGRFSVNVDPSWERIKADGDYVQYKVPSPPMNVYMLPLKASTVEDAFRQSFETLGFDSALLANGGTMSLGDWSLFSTKDAEGLTYGLAGQIVGENAFVFLAKSEKPGIDPENPALFRVLTSVQLAGKEEVVVTSLADLEAEVRQRVDKSSGSISIAVVDHGKIVYTYVYGPANPAAGIQADTETIYQMGSMTKMFTATAVMQQVEQGRVNLDAWPGEYVPEFPAAWKVTVRQLLDHSACLSEQPGLSLVNIALGPETFPPLQEVLTGYVRDLPGLGCEPGSISQYSNPHYLVLARIVEEVSGEPYDAYVLRHILAPLDMPSTTFELTAADERYANGTLPTTVADNLVASLNEYRGPGQEKLILDRGETYTTLALYRVLPPWGGLRGTPSEVTHFLQMHLHGGRYGDVQLLKPETVAAMQQTQTANDGSDLGVGLGWWPGEDASGTYVYHSGTAEGSNGTMRLYPDLDLGVVVMANMQGYKPENLSGDAASAWLHESK
jgi:CubicO group peptidase (beta-lactamase class C family)